MPRKTNRLSFGIGVYAWAFFGLIAVFVCCGFIGIPTIKVSNQVINTNVSKTYTRVEIQVDSPKQDLEFEKSAFGAALTQVFKNDKTFEQVYYFRKPRQTDADLRVVIHLNQYEWNNSNGDSYNVKMQANFEVVDNTDDSKLGSASLDGAVSYGWKPEAVIIIMCEKIRDFIKSNVKTRGE